MNMRDEDAEIQGLGGAVLLVVVVGLGFAGLFIYKIVFGG